MKIAVTGSNGALGSDLVKVLGQSHEVVALTHDDIQIEDAESVAVVINRIKPDWVINPAAYHDVAQCEENPDQAFRVNAVGAFNLARSCNAIGCGLVQISTDYVFEGLKTTPYVEADEAKPVNIYGASKLAGEKLVANYCDKWFVVRVCGVYGHVVTRAKGRNFITTMVKLAREKDVVKVVTDEFVSPTNTAQIARQINDLLQTEAYDVYHVTANGQCSWYEFARLIFDELNLQTPLEPTTSTLFAAPVRRPLYSVLENGNLKKLGMDNMAHWRDIAIQHLREMRV